MIPARQPWLTAQGPFTGALLHYWARALAWAAALCPSTPLPLRALSRACCPQKSLQRPPARAGYPAHLPARPQPGPQCPAPRAMHKPDWHKPNRRKPTMRMPAVRKQAGRDGPNKKAPGEPEPSINPTCKRPCGRWPGKIICLWAARRRQP